MNPRTLEVIFINHVWQSCQQKTQIYCWPDTNWIVSVEQFLIVSQSLPKAADSQHHIEKASGSKARSHFSNMAHSVILAANHKRLLINSKNAYSKNWNPRAKLPTNCSPPAQPAGFTLIIWSSESRFRPWNERSASYHPSPAPCKRSRSPQFQRIRLHQILSEALFCLSIACLEEVVSTRDYWAVTIFTPSSPSHS